jgi:hypothetical protein
MVRLQPFKPFKPSKLNINLTSENFFVRQVSVVGTLSRIHTHARDVDFLVLLANKGSGQTVSSPQVQILDRGGLDGRNLGRQGPHARRGTFLWHEPRASLAFHRKIDV